MSPLQQQSRYSRPYNANGMQAGAPGASIGASGGASGGASAGTSRGVTVSPSRQEIRRADPSTSFHVVAPGARSFDVIVATDPALFDPAEAHRRTPRNFRSSRQDFQGTPIEIETGFYLLPRAFLRELISVEPRPSRLYYVAVAYEDAEGRMPGIYSVAPEAMAGAAPSILIGSDLVAANLSKVLGMAVDRLGAVNGSGRVMAADPRPHNLPEAIGGLPIIRRAPPATGGTAANGAAGIVNGALAPADPPAQPAAQPSAQPPRAQAPAPQPGAGNGAAIPREDASLPPEAPHAAAPDAPAGGFVDDDYAYGGSGAGGYDDGFRDLDADPAGMSRHAGGEDYDDGFGAPIRGPADAPANGAAPAQPIPPLDPAPEPAPEAVRPQPAAAAPQPQQPAPRGNGRATPGDASGDDMILRAVIDEGAGGRYEALSLDGGYRGRFGTANPYYQRAHDGLRLGPHQAMQDSGELGELLALMQSADPAAFDRIFGAEADALIATTTAAGPSSLDSADGRGARVQPVGGRDLWDEPWVERFRAACRHPAFQAAMRAQILARRLAPMEPVAEALGIASDRGRAMLMALAIQLGTEGARAHARAAANPFDTPARLGAALDALGYSDLGAFRAASGLAAGDTVDAQTHFALFAALRQLGAQSPVQVPDGEGVMDLLVTAAGPGPVGDALLRLRVSSAFGEPGHDPAHEQGEV